MKFFKYHALGNDYIVIDPKDCPTVPTAAQIKVICHRNFGVGSDGILYGPLPSTRAPLGLRIFNPDASEAEKSGNGLRIFSRYLRDRGLVQDKEFAIDTLGGVVKSTVKDAGKTVRVEMGCVSFWSDEIPVTGPRREVLREELRVGGATFSVCCATVGNPHCVIPFAELNENIARKYGPLIETHEWFPKRINVQFLQVIDRNNIRIEIWERGAGYTLASGSSSSAAAAVAHKLGLVDSSVAVHMPGGQIFIEIGNGYSILMTGSVTKVAEGTIAPEMFETTTQAIG